MADFSKIPLSGSTDGKMIKVAATSTPGTTIHTSTSSATGFDEIWLWAQNNHTADVLLTIELGGTTSPDDLIQYTVPTKAGLKIILPGVILRNSLVLKAFAGTTNVISLAGYANRGV